LVPHLAFLLVSLLSALGWLLTKLAVVEMGPYAFISIRFLLASLVLLAFCLPALMRLSSAQIKRGLFTGLFLGVQMAVWVTVLNMSDHIGLGAFIGGTSFIFITLLGAMFFSAPIVKETWISLVIVGFGLLLLNVETKQQLHWMDTLFLISAILYALYFNISAKYAASIPSMPLTALQLCAASVVNLMASIVSGENLFQGIGKVWDIILVSVILASAIRYYLQVIGQSFGNSASVAIILTFDPVWVALLSYWWLEESFSVQKMIGCAVIFAAVIFNTVKLYRFRENDQKQLFQSAK